MDRMNSADILQYYWPDWHIVRQIGHGSFGDVFECDKTDGVRPGFFDPQSQDADSIAVKRSAIKVISIPQHESQIAQLRAEGIDANSTAAYFEKIAEDCVREIKTMESVKSCPNVVYIEDFKVARKPDGIGWTILIRMELLTSLADYLDTHKMGEKDILKLGMDLCNALDTCHKKHIIHRDIKPGNIMVNENGDFKLADFGIARELDKSEMGLSKKGTYSYMAPEMEIMDTYDHRVDLYALGIVLYQLLNNNRAPFLNPFDTSVSYESKSAASMRRLRGESFGPPLNGSDATKNAVMRACAYLQEDRFSSAAQMYAALREASRSLPDVGFADDPDTPNEIELPQNNDFTRRSVPVGGTRIARGQNAREEQLFIARDNVQQQDNRYWQDNRYPQDRSYPVQNGPYSQQNGPYSQPTPPEDDDDDNGNSTKIAVIILIAAVVFCAILAGIYLYLNKEDDDETTTTSTAATTQEEPVTEAPSQTETESVSNMDIPLTKAPTAATTAAPVQLVPGYTYLTADALKLRGGPGKSYADLGTVYKGTVVRYLGQQGGGYSYIEYYLNGVRHEGWVLTNYLKTNTTGKDHYNGSAAVVTNNMPVSTVAPYTTTTTRPAATTTTRPATTEARPVTEEPTVEEPWYEPPEETQEEETTRRLQDLIERLIGNNTDGHEGLVLRSEPNASSGKLGVLPEGTKVYLTGQTKNGYTFVVTRDGRTGWVLEYYLK